MTESIFTSGGLLEVLNQKNLLIILNLDNYVYISPQILSTINIDQLSPYLFRNKTEICFRITEPSLETFVPQVSEPKIGTLIDYHEDSSILEIQLREDFRLANEEADQQLMMVFPDGKYQGDGLYKLNLTEILGMYVQKHEDPHLRLFFPALI